MPSPDYSFVATTSDAENSAPIEYRFVVDEDGQPRKLGDGTYGVVFEAQGAGDERCAVKIFYPFVENSPSAERTAAEMRSGVTVLEALRTTNEENLISNLVLSKAWTEHFLCSPAYDNLQDAFGQLNIKVSNNALVMPYYECTLKDVLEAGAPPNRLVRGNPYRDHGSPGYDILRSLAVSERERHVIGIVSQVVTGLRALHAANLFHHDIKPSNVMLRSTQFHVDVALADFGFLKPTVDRGDGGYPAQFPFGTRHYRSPEQKDYFDVCDVTVFPSRDKEHLVLETLDRKFRDTLIETGDIARFSKELDGPGYQVRNVEHLPQQKSLIYLRPERATEAEDARTQVMFYKKPSLRTDVFGVGALLFDLLTTGQSPECFYDYLRPFDRTDQNQVPAVSLIVERYRATASANSTSSDLAPLFEQIRDNLQGRFPSAEIVTVLLRCMLSQAPDSYYCTALADDGVVDRKKLFSAIQDDLSHLGGSSDVPIMVNTNPIWAGERLESETNEAATTFLGDMHDSLQLTGRKRIVKAALRWRQLVQMIGRIRNHGKFFADLSPGNLRFEQSGSEVASVVESYKSEQDYLLAAQTGSAWRLETTGDTDNYVPVCRRFDVRSVEVMMPPTNYSGHDVISAKARYTESLPVWRNNRPGDLLRTIDGRGRSRLFCIVTISTVGAWQQMEIQEVTFGNTDTDASNQRDEQEGDAVEVAVERPEVERVIGSLIHRLFPMNYYLSIMATYLHHLFFVDGSTDDGTIPQAVWSVLQSGDSGRGHSFVERHGGASLKRLWSRNAEVPASDIRSLAAGIYLDLISAAETREGTGDPDERALYVQLSNLNDVLDDAVTRLCGFRDPGELRALRIADIESMSDDPAEADTRTFSDYVQAHLDRGRGFFSK